MANTATEVVNFEIITAQSIVPGPETGLELTFVDFAGNPSARAMSARPVGFEPGYGGLTNLVWLNSVGDIDKMPVDALRGVEDLKTSSDPFEAEVVFGYYKQLLGAEAGKRVLRLTGIAYGIHEGHTGDIGKQIPAEKPTWYMVGSQIGQIDHLGTLKEQQPVDRVFPFTRILNGPVGDPTDPLYRKRHGIY